MAASGAVGGERAGGAPPGPSEPGWAAPGAATTPPAGPTPPAVPSPGPGGRPATAEVAPPVPLRPLTIGDVVDGAFQVVKRAPGVVLGLSALVVLPVQVLVAWLQRDSVSDLEALLGDTSAQLQEGSSTVEGAELGLTFVLLALESIPPAFVGAGLAVLVTAWCAGRTLAVGDVLRRLGGVAPALIGAFLVSHLAIGVGFVACVLPGTVLMVLFVLAMPVAAVERVGPLAALGRSASLVGKRFWRSAGVVALSVAGSFVLDLSLTFVPTVVALFVPEAWGWVVLGVGSSLASMLVTPVVAAATVLLYLDLRFRQEGLDLELRATDVLETAGW